jgi:DNA polymerase I
MAEEKLIVIDSSSLLYRAFFALPPLTNNKGQSTGAVYGFLLTLFKAIKDVGATHIVACFDTPKPTFRHEEFADYKAHRLPPPDSLISQFPILKEVLRVFCIPIFQKEGFEADDLIATIAKKAAGQEGCEVFIVSGDLDNLQLVDERIKLYTLGKSVKETIIYDTRKVIERFGVKPSQMNDFKALTGDSSDNIPGVPGIGKKTASEIIQKYDSIESLYSELATDTAVLKPKIKEALRQNKEQAILSLKLVRTNINSPVEFDFASCLFGKYDAGKVKDLFLMLGFNSLVGRLSSLNYE